MKIGALGDLAFTVDQDKMQNFEKLKWSSSANYQTHSLHLRKGRIELTGFNPDEASFEMELSAFLGVNPRKALAKLEKMKDKGSVNKLVIGTQVIGEKWVVSKIAREVKYVYQDGEIVAIRVTVTLTEYAGGAA